MFDHDDIAGQPCVGVGEGKIVVDKRGGICYTRNMALGHIGKLNRKGVVYVEQAVC